LDFRFGQELNFSRPQESAGLLVAAGVSAYSRTVNGTCHAGDMIFRKALPEVYAATQRDIKGFADSL
jgi:hypothetical protein